MTGAGAEEGADGQGPQMAPHEKLTPEEVSAGRVTSFWVQSPLMMNGLF
jgi:hypothetical protein